MNLNLICIKFFSIYVSQGHLQIMINFRIQVRKGKKRPQNIGQGKSKIEKRQDICNIYGCKYPYVNKYGYAIQLRTYIHICHKTMVYICTLLCMYGLWQYWQWSFGVFKGGRGGSKLDRLLPKNQHTQRKLRIRLMGRSQKFGIILENKLI